MTNTLLTYITCKDIFRSHYDLNNHVRRDHQSSIKIKFQNDDVAKVKRGENNAFKCKCGKSFKFPNSLRRHGKGYNDELTKSEKDDEERVLMNVNDSDALESMNRIVSTDCFGVLISYEKC